MAEQTYELHDEFEAFCHEVREMDAKALEKLPNYIDLRKNEHNIEHPLLHLSRRAYQQQQDSVSMQGAYFDFSGHCLSPICGIKTKHPHSIQMPGCMEVEGFPGLFIYQGLFSWIQWKLMDAILHELLSDPANTTNLDDEYHITYPHTTDGSDKHASFFGSEAIPLSMEPRLREDWAKWPLSSKQFVEKLRWVEFHHSDGPVPQAFKRVTTLVEALLPIQAKTIEMQISKSTHLDSHPKENTALTDFVDITLGSSAILVVGLEMPLSIPSPEAVEAAANTRVNSDESWLDFVNGLSESEDDDEASTDETCEEREHVGSANRSSQTQLLALRVNSGDAILFSRESARAEVRNAKVLAGSMPQWEQQWPCVPGSPQWLQSWKTCMHGKHIDLIIR